MQQIGLSALSDIVQEERGGTGILKTENNYIYI
jgi:hypothetical protein